MKKILTFATSNKGKIAWLQRALAIEGLGDWLVASRDLNLIEIQSDSVAEISLYKARQAYEELKHPVLVMDGGFYINELNGFPGPYTSYVVDKLGAIHMAKLAGTLTDRSCYFENVTTYIDSNGRSQQFTDHTGNIFTLTDQVWPVDHPSQWSALWRILIPTGVGYDAPLASFSEEKLNEYMQRRLAAGFNSSSLDAFVRYFKTTLQESHPLMVQR